MRVYLGLDQKCISPEKIATGKLGGTERRFIILANWLEQAGHFVSYEADPGITRYDAAVHSNSFYPGVDATRHILWAGSWHCNPSEYPYDRVVFVSQFMKSRYPDFPDADVIPACFQEDIWDYRTDDFVPHRIVTSSNPNRYLNHAVTICKALERAGIEFEWHFAGGNKLYADFFPECWQDSEHPRLIYHGVLTRAELLRLLSTAHIYAYPNFSDDSETFGKAPVEAAALGVPVLLPDREPFREVMAGDANYARSIPGFTKAIKRLFKTATRRNCDMSRYSEKVVAPQILRIIEGDGR